MDLQTAWFGLFGTLIIGYAVLDGFDLGVGALSLLARDDTEHRLHLNAVGPVWDGNEVWLLTAGGALFAAFPPVYATVFSGLYLALMLLLVALIARAVSFEFRSKVASPRWRAAWDLAFGLGSLVPPVLFGVAVGNILRGLPLDPEREFAGSFLGLLTPFPLLVGLLSLCTFVAHGAAYMALKSEGALCDRMHAWALRAWAAWTTLFLAASAAAPFVSPFLFQGTLSRPLLWLSLALTIAGLGLFPLAIRARSYARAFLASSTAIFGTIALAGTSLYPRLVPALGNLDRSLTVYNASSTPRTLTVTLVIALAGMPLVVGYTAFIYRTFKGKTHLGPHSY
ncbi:MAG: cytochrome d ubiquinol oxidase subunit II [Deltaproteobacteria bacterium]|nr:cytochrome d ubiquinol oxidase subunit II [Deltaproteobacteria bacterium]